LPIASGIYPNAIFSRWRYENMVQKLKAQIGVHNGRSVATLIKVTPEWLTLKEPGKRPYRIRRSEMRSIESIDSPEDIQIQLMKKLIESMQPGSL